MGTVSAYRNIVSIVIDESDRIRAAAHYAATMRARDAAEKFSQELKVSTAQPALSERHRQLDSLLQIGLNELPRTIDSSFPRPSHSAYPEQKEQSGQVVEILSSAWVETVTTLEKCQTGLSWYQSLVRARQNIFDNRADMQALMEEFERTIADLLQGRPDIGVVEIFNNEPHRWVLTLPARLDKMRVLRQTSSQAVQLATVTLLRYRQTARAPPKVWRAEISWESLGDDLMDEAERRAEQLHGIISKALKIARMISQDSEILPIVHGIIQASSKTDQAAVDLRCRFDMAINANAWHPGKAAPTAIRLFKDVEELECQMEDNISAPISNLKDLLKSYQRDELALCNQLSELAANAADHRQGLRVLLDLLERITEQATVVREVEEEAECLLHRIEAAQEEIERLSRVAWEIGDEAQTLNETRSLKQHISQSLAADTAVWESGLISRIRFVSCVSSASMTESLHRSLLQDRITSDTPASRVPLLPSYASAADPPMTPPTSPIATPRLQQSVTNNASKYCHPLDLDVLNHNVRKEVNNRASLVASAMSHCDVSIEKHELQMSTRKQIAADELQLALQRWIFAVEDFDSQRYSLQSDMDRTPSSVHEAETAMCGVEALRRHVIATMETLATDVNKCRLRLTAFVSAGPTNESDDRLSSPHADWANTGFHAIPLLTLCASSEKVPYELSRVVAVTDIMHANAEAHHRVQSQAAANDIFGTTTTSPQVMSRDYTVELSTMNLRGDTLSQESLSLKSSLSTSLGVNSRSISRPLTNPTYSSSTMASRSRASSDSSFRARSLSLRSGQLPRLRKESNGQRMSLGSLMLINTPSSPSPAYNNRPAPSATMGMRPRRKTQVFRTYIADPRSELDVAVGNIVNKLSVRFRSLWT